MRNGIWEWVQGEVVAVKTKRGTWSWDDSEVHTLTVRLNQQPQRPQRPQRPQPQVGTREIEDRLSAALEEYARLEDQGNKLQKQIDIMQAEADLLDETVEAFANVEAARLLAIGLCNWKAGMRQNVWLVSTLSTLPWLRC